MIRKLTLTRLAAIVGVGVVVACGSVNAGSGSTACTTLESCCLKATGAAQVECLQTVTARVDTSCTEELVSLTTSGSCSTTTSTSTSTATTGITGCAALDECCASMTTGTEKTTCLGFVSDGNASVCNAELAVYEGNDSCSIVGTGTGTGTTTGSGGVCATLDACCSQLPASSQTACSAVVAAGNAATCADDLDQAQMAGFCVGVGTGTGTGVTSTGTGTGVTSTGTGTTTTSISTSTNTSTSATPTCASPPATLPAGFVAPTGIIGSGACTAAQTSALGVCLANPPTTDAGTTSCDDILGTSTALNACGTCVEGTDIVPGQPIPATWGYEIVAAIYGTLGDTSSLYPIEYSLNYGGCLIGASPSKTSQCGLDVMAASACELAVCLPLCAVPEADANNSGAFDGLVACTQAADAHACLEYVNAENTDCASLEADGGLIDQCNTLYSADSATTGTATAAQQADLIGLVCGGADAGF